MEVMAVMILRKYRLLIREVKLGSTLFLRRWSLTPWKKRKNIILEKGILWDETGSD